MSRTPDQDGDVAGPVEGAAADGQEVSLAAGGVGEEGIGVTGGVVGGTVGGTV
jgi:hypothetical protein